MAEVGTVIALTGEDDRFEAVRSKGIDLARQEHATLVLYDIDAPVSPLESPVPTQWSAEGTEDELGGRLGPEELEAAGHAVIARQVAEARRSGVDAWGWLPSDSGREAIIDYAARQPGARLLVPAGDDEEELADLPEAEVVPAGR